MNDLLIPLEIVVERLGIDPNSLVRYERLGLIHAVREAGVVGYSPSEVRRIWSIVTYQRDLGVNLAGVEILLKLRDQRDELHRLLSALTIELRDALDSDPENAPDA